MMSETQLWAALFGIVGFCLVVFVAMLLFGVSVTGAAKNWQKRQAPLSRIYRAGEPLHSVGPDIPVSECVRLMTDARIGALVILEGGQLVGIFTERDALNRVLSRELDPKNTKVSDVMTRNPCCVDPTTKVSDALRLITNKRFRHLPVTENGKVTAVVSSGDLTHWLVEV